MDQIELKFAFSIGERKNVVSVIAYPDAPFKEAVIEACEKYGLKVANVTVTPFGGSGITATELNDDTVEEIVRKYGIYFNIVDRGIVG
ncbi:MAG: hypothetical protein QXL15_01120 [Candidatus Korarchaeota archaeon]